MAFTLPAGSAANFTVRAETYPQAANALDFKYPTGSYTAPTVPNVNFQFGTVGAPLADWVRPIGSAVNFMDGVLVPRVAIGAATVGVTADGFAKASISAHGAVTMEVSAVGVAKLPVSAHGATTIGVTALGYATITRRVSLRTRAAWAAPRAQMRSVDSAIPKTSRKDRPADAPWCAARSVPAQSNYSWRKAHTLDPAYGSQWGTSGIRRDEANQLPWGLSVPLDTEKSAPWSFFGTMLTVDQLNRWRGSKTADVLKNAIWASRLIETRLPIEQPRAVFDACNFAVIGGGITTLMPNGAYVAPMGDSVNFKFGTEPYRLPFMTSRALDHVNPVGNSANFDYRPTYITLRDEFGEPVLRGAETQTVSVLPWGASKVLDKDQAAPWAKFSRPLNPGWGIVVPPGPTEPVPGETTTIPVQRVYIVLNEVLLLRVSDSAPITASALSVSFDCDSWLPQFSATIPESARSLIMPNPSPVEVVVYINDTEFRFFVERIARSREFGKNEVAISGRGIACELDAPYATASQHTNGSTMTAQQIIDAALTNTGYAQAWGITDWSVPASTFSLFGTPAEVAANVADASGSVLQAHRNSRILRMLPRYPLKHWDWSNNTLFSATGPVIIPASVAQAESIEWVEKPSYNVVYVSGVQNGVLGQVKITGTAGDLPAAMVTHPLITHVDAARQKGIAILSDTGRKAMMQITMPVLPASGVIDVCRMVEFNDGVTARRGIVRANSVSVNWPTVRQTLTIEAAV